jgi:hypothetical protein
VQSRYVRAAARRCDAHTAVSAGCLGGQRGREAERMTSKHDNDATLHMCSARPSRDRKAAAIADGLHGG